jgi:deazaflavin-dependent oxidoreductase (nitroreductase family)
MTHWQKRLEVLKDRSTCRITTRGRRSGRPHTVTIWFVVGEAASIYLGTLRMGRDWPKNVLADSAVTIEIDDLRLRAEARQITDHAAQADVARRLAGKYWAAWIGSWFGLAPEGAFELRVSGEAT